MKPTIRWTKNESAMLKMMIAKGFSPEEVCKVLKDRSTSSVRSHAKIQGWAWTYIKDGGIIDQKAFDKIIKEREVREI